MRGRCCCNCQSTTEVRLFLCAKNNLAPDTGGYSYVVKSNDDNVPYIEWSDERETRTADEVLGGAIDKKNAIDNVEDWLLDVLDAGPVHSKRMKELARDAGHSWRTVERARERLDSSIKIERDVIAGHGAQGPWQWRLTTPSRPTPPPPTVNTGGLGGDE